MEFISMLMYVLAKSVMGLSVTLLVTYWFNRFSKGRYRDVHKI